MNKDFFRLPEQFFSVDPAKPRVITASERVLNAVYKAAKLGVKKPALMAAACDLSLSEYNQLAACDPMVDAAIDKGVADSEMELLMALRTQALSGDVKAIALMGTHKRDWMPARPAESGNDGKVVIEIRNLDTDESKIVVNPAHPMPTVVDNHSA